MCGSLPNNSRKSHVISMGPCTPFSHGPHFYRGPNFDMKFFGHSFTYVDYKMPVGNIFISAGIEIAARFMGFVFFGTPDK
jgi:hypothetical protein